MVLQKAMKQGRHVHSIPLLDACSDHNITSRMCGHVGGHCLLLRGIKAWVCIEKLKVIYLLKHFTKEFQISYVTVIYGHL